MSKIMPSMTTLATLLVLWLAVAPVHAQQSRSFVSGFGNDANAPNCTRTAPCRTFQAAHNGTLANGEITVLDPGSYGSVTINQSISIVNDGVGEAGLLVSGGATGITINAGTVTLRGLTLKGIGFGGGNGINFNVGSVLNVENCTIRNLDGAALGNGLIFDGQGAAVLNVTNTFITDNGGFGIWIRPLAPATTMVVLDRVSLSNNASGLMATDEFGLGGTIRVSVNNSIVNNNRGVGLFAEAVQTMTAAIAIYVNRSVVAFNAGTGVVASSGSVASATLFQSVIVGNAKAWDRLPGPIFSYGNNAVTDNLNPEPAATPIATK